METETLPFYSLELACFTCPCTKNAQFDTWEKYKQHRQKRKRDHETIPTFVPQCPLCARIILFPKTHHHEDPADLRDPESDLKKKDPKRDPEMDHQMDHQKDHDQDLEFKRILHKPQLETKSCKKCNKLIFSTTLNRAKLWKKEWYCPTCFQQVCKPLIRINRELLKLLLWEKNRFHCCICDEKLEKKDLSETIFEHVNPYLKMDLERDITQSIWKGTSITHLTKICEEDHVLLAHLTCAQMKTTYESTTGEFRDKAWLTRARNNYEISMEAYQEAMKQKEQVYDQQVLPQIRKFIAIKRDSSLVSQPPRQLVRRPRSRSQ